jgi:hypothetical protein
MEVQGDLTAGLVGQEDLFPFGGSVGHLEGVDCGEDGTVVASSAVPSGGGGVLYDLTRRFLTIEDGRFVQDRVRTERVTIDQLQTFPEYQAGPFGSC